MMSFPIIWDSRQVGAILDTWIREKPREAEKTEAAWIPL